MALIPLSKFNLLDDDRSRQVSRVAPRSFDLVNQGRLPTSKAFLFRFPTEILSLILEYIPGYCLRYMALADRDLRQLARSRQFAQVVFDYSPQSWALLTQLLNEIQARDKSNGLVKQTIGSCVRQIKVVTDQLRETQLHGFAPREWHLLPTENRERAIQAATRRHARYLKGIGSLISVGGLGPQLDLFEFEEHSAAEHKYFDFEALLSSGVRHLNLKGLSVRPGFELSIPNQQFRPTYLPNLKTLFLDTKYGRKISSGLIEVCSETLECLIWKGCRNTLDPQTFTNKELSFPKLQKLTLIDIDFVDASDLLCLLNAPLIAISMKLSITTALTALKRRGCIPTLNTLIWDLYGDELVVDKETEWSMEILPFFEANQQLLKLVICWEWSGLLVCEKLLRLLACRFDALISLSLSCDAVNKIPLGYLHLISNIKSLEQIHLNVGEKRQGQSTWPINHDSMRQHLSQLTKLRRILFTSDSYSIGPRNPSVERYYDLKYLFGRPAQGPLQVATWEDQHTVEMLKECDRYAALMPRLELIYVGQLSIGGFDGRAFLNCGRRLDYENIIQKMFGFEEAILPKMQMLHPLTR